ncbi:MAG: hypothetical protein KY476_07940 [Planctomycetes bacterium]|nr:hypothetical protein [Planctomycetota bacterium]
MDSQSRAILVLAGAVVLLAAAVVFAASVVILGDNRSAWLARDITFLGAIAAVALAVIAAVAGRRPPR